MDVSGFTDVALDEAAECKPVSLVHGTAVDASPVDVRAASTLSCPCALAVGMLVCIVVSAVLLVVAYALSWPRVALLVLWVVAVVCVAPVVVECAVLACCR
jgi:hypothetical protein